jgi:hypothetical protein
VLALAAGVGGTLELAEVLGAGVELPDCAGLTVAVAGGEAAAGTPGCLFPIAKYATKAITAIARTAPAPIPPNINTLELPSPDPAAACPADPTVSMRPHLGQETSLPIIWGVAASFCPQLQGTKIDMV